MIDAWMCWTSQMLNSVNQIRSCCIGNVCQSGNIHVAEAFTEETQLLGCIVGEIVSEGSGDVQIVGALKGGAPPTCDGDANLNT